jgi:hypothetical protein
MTARGRRPCRSRSQVLQSLWRADECESNARCGGGGVRPGRRRRNDGRPARSSRCRFVVRRELRDVVGRGPSGAGAGAGGEVAVGAGWRGGRAARSGAGAWARPRRTPPTLTPTTATTTTSTTLSSMMNDDIRGTNARSSVPRTTATATVTTTTTTSDDSKCAFDERVVPPERTRRGRRRDRRRTRDDDETVTYIEPTGAIDANETTNATTTTTTTRARATGPILRPRRTRWTGPRSMRRARWTASS